jgi:hypothetical protein
MTDVSEFFDPGGGRGGVSDASDSEVSRAESAGCRV